MIAFIIKKAQDIEIQNQHMDMMHTHNLYEIQLYIKAIDAIIKTMRPVHKDIVAT